VDYGNDNVNRLGGKAGYSWEFNGHNGALLNSEQKLKAVLYSSPIPQFVIDRDHQVVYWNNALEEITRIRASEVIGTNQHWRAFYSTERPCLADLMVDGDIERIPDLYQGKYSRSKLVAGAYEATEYFPSLGEGGKWLFFTAAVIRDVSGEAIGALETLEDITESKQTEEEILTLSITDQLTGLHNRRGFLFLAEQQLRLSDRTKNGLLLFFADLDGMKWINDTLGHKEGDSALIEAAMALKETFRSSDVIARMGGDEFAVLAIDTPEVNAEILTGRLQSMVDARNNQENRKYKLSISVGCSFYDPENPCSIDELMAAADQLMYEHKRRKKSGST
jgi:diguanylate cyclase (GGDEF)-like protein/PAS domain S-box-containing protein